MDYGKILERSLELSKPYWDLYDQLIGSKLTKPEATVGMARGSGHEVSREQEDDDLNPEYLKLMKITREHQAKREKQKRLRQKKGLDAEIYFRDISQIDTLVEDNLVEAPNRYDKSADSRRKEHELIELYGGREAFESVRSLEMTIDDNFHRKYQELKPGYWPVIPINYKRYLNSIE